MRLAAPANSTSHHLVRLLRGASATALCIAAMSGVAQAQDGQSVPTTGANQPSPTGSKAGPGTAGVATPPTSETGTGGSQVSSTGANVDAQTAAASDAGQNAPGDVVVTGIRQSLANAQNIKRNADTVVDAITATDIGALPDRSVTEALQRVPGVSIERFAGNNDPDHFSVEGSGVFVRGLNFVRSEFNGRDTFSAGVGGQAINFSDVPAELLGSVEVFKNVTAENIEGGLAGTVNLNTRKPFDNKGFHVGFDGEGNYGDFEKKWSPTGSLLVSDTWDTPAGRFGLLGDVSYSRIRSRADGIQVTNFQTRDGQYALAADTSGSSSTYVCRNQLPSNTDTMTQPPAYNATTHANACGTPQSAGADGFADYLPVAYAPLGGQFRTQDYDRKRDGIAVAGQWESTDGKTLFTGQFLRTHTTNAWGEHTFETAPDLSEYNTFPAGCLQNGDGPGAFPFTPVASNPTTTTRAECPDGKFQNYTYNSNGLFQSGLITEPGSGYRSSCSGTAACYVPTGGQQQSLSRRQVYEENTVNDFGANLKTKLSDHLDANLDFDYTKSRHNETDFSVFGSTFADQSVDITGNLPVVVPQKPLTLNAAWATPNPKLVAESNAQYFQDPNVEFWRAAMDHIEQSDGREYAAKADFVWHFDDGFLRDVKFGARYADRDETVRYTAYNWGALSEVWSGSNPVSFAQSPANSSFYTFPDFFRGATPGPVGGYYYNGDLINGYNNAANYFTSIANTWHTVNGAGAGTWVPLAARAGVVPGTPFLPSEIQPVTDQTADVYGQIDFGRNERIFGNVRLSGNVGLRFVSDDITSAGSIGAPTQQALGIAQDRSSLNCTPMAPAGSPPGTSASLPPLCNLSPAAYAQLQQFANGSTTPDTARVHYSYLLPSVNLKFGLSQDLLLRLAGSKVLTKPDLANIRDFLTIGLDTSSGFLTATAGNPYLKPATAWQFDASVEWYFARVGSLTFDAFYKSIHNFFYSSITTRNLTSNGITEPIIVRAPANYDGYGKIKGFEVAYQQTFDFLPGFLKGLGTSLNYTFIDSNGLPNAFLNGGVADATSTVPKGNLPLEGLSKHNVNAEIFYEKGRISLRAAYNWRSQFLLTASDVIFPYYSIFQGAGGQLDASAFFNLTKQIKIGVQGVNLNNQVTKTLQAYTTDPSLLAPRSYFVNDRRYSFIIRGNF